MTLACTSSSSVASLNEFRPRRQNWDVWDNRGAFSMRELSSMKGSSSGSAETAHTPELSGTGDQRAHELTRWAWLMIPGTALGALAAFLVGSLLMRATGTPDGNLLTSSGIAGWISWVAVVVSQTG